MDKLHSTYSRRSLLLAIGGATIAAGALVAAPFRSSIARRAIQIVSERPRRARSPALASFEEWQAWVGARFSVGGVPMRLAGVRALPSAGDRPSLLRDRAFVAMFDPGGGQTMAGDLIYTASLAGHAPIPLFLSVSPDPRTPARMLAVFN